MLVDATQFPFVWMKTGPSSQTTADNPFEAFEALLARQEMFVLLNEEGLRAERHEHTPEERKQLSLWMKRHKGPVRAFVKAAIYVEPNTLTRLATQPFTLIYEKFWGYPMLITASREDAMTRARELLVK